MDKQIIEKLYTDLDAFVDRERCRQALIKCGGNIELAKKYLKVHSNVATNHDMVKKKGHR